MLHLKEENRLTKLQESCFHHRRKLELYDLQLDPSESKNLIDDAAYASVVTRLQGVLQEWAKETGDYIPNTSHAGRIRSCDGRAKS